MENFEKIALENYELKPKIWLRYVDDIFVIWPHGRDELNLFLNYLNSQHEKIKFTIELENNNSLPFLDTLLYKKNNGTFGHTIYRKPTHTNRYLNSESHHHPAQLKSVAASLYYRANKLADRENKNKELKIVKQALQLNGYSGYYRKQIKNKKEMSQDKKILGSAKIPYIRGVSEKIGRILSKENIRTIYQPYQKIGSILPNGKDKITNETQGVYKIACKDCDKIYIGQTNRRISQREIEHKNAIKNFDENSSLAIHTFDKNHQIDFSSTKTIAKVSNPLVRINRESIEIELNKEIVMNKRDDSKSTSKSWLPILNLKKNILINKSHTQTLINYSKLSTKDNTKISLTTDSNKKEKTVTRRSTRKVSSRVYRD